MTFSFNSEKHRELLLEYQSKTIGTEAENQKALIIVEELMHLSQRSPEQNELYELLVTLIEKFEQEYYSPRESLTPQSLLLFLTEQQGCRLDDLVEILGSTETLFNILDGKQEVSPEQAKALGKFFKVNTNLFQV